MKSVGLVRGSVSRAPISLNAHLISQTRQVSKPTVHSVIGTSQAAYTVYKI